MLGHFRVTARLGAGGMGEVYRAEDTRLGREVAIKLLPEAFTADPERLARFEREARVLAALNHPPIAAIHSFETAPAGTVTGRAEAGPVHFLVMELAPGETLAERIARGSVPIEEALPIAIQIAEALEAAHEKGIIHRDLKPANVKVDADGRVKVLDFGLARALEPTPEPGADATVSPTLTAMATRQGVILGTAAYMAPEQAKGRAADRRSDVWAFGLVLYEMLTGQRLFLGDSMPETLAEVLKGSIDLARLPAETPPAVRRLLRRCLVRDPRQRLHDIADARIVLQEVRDGVDGSETETRGLPSATAPPARRSSLTWLAALVVASAVAGLAGYVARPPGAVPAAPLRLAIQLAPGQDLIADGNAILAFAPDGRSLVLTGRENGRQTLFRRVLGERETRPIFGTEDGESAFFSPDGRWIGFAARGQLMKVAAQGGRPFRLAGSRGSGGAAWLPDDTLVFAPIYSDGLFRVSAEGGEAERLTTPDRAAGELGHWWPDPLPGARRVLFTAFRTPVDRSRVGVLDLATGEVRWLVEGGFFGRYVASGHLLYAKGQRLFALPFDAARAIATGPAVAVVDDLATDATGGYGMFAVSRQGTLAYVTESLGHPPRELVWADRAGHAQPAASERHRYTSASLSLDGRHAAVTIQQESLDLWTYAFERGTLSRVTSDPGTEYDPVWSRDGRELFFVVDRPPFELHRITLGSPDAGHPIWDEPAELDTQLVAVAPNGRSIAFVRSEAETGLDLYVRPLDGSEPPRPVRATRAEETFAAFSPDGRWLAYQSDETGRPEIYVEAFPGPGERFQVSADGGTEPVWARGSGEIFFRHGDELRLVTTRLVEGFEFEPPLTLFSLPLAHGDEADTRSYDVTADGTRILAIRTPEASVPRQIEIVTDWTSELARLAPQDAP